MEEFLARWQRFRDGPLAQGLYRGRITVEGKRLLDSYQTALISAVRELQVPGRTAPLELEKVYVPIRVTAYTSQRIVSPEQEAQSSDQPPSKTLSVEDALRISPHVLLLGQPGSGKSTTLQSLAFRFIRQEVPADYLRQLTLGRSGQHPERFLPILVSLPDLAHSDKNLVTFLSEALAAHLPYPHLFIAEKLQRGECLLLLDDLDKIADEAKRAQVATEIQRLTEQYPLNYVIVTSRTNSQDFPPNFKRWWALGLDDAGIDDLVTRWYADQPEQAQAMRQAMQRNQRLRSLAANPLFLSILLVSHAGNPERPVRCAALYERMLRILLRPEVGQPSPTFWKEQFLQELALEIHTSQARSLGRGELRDRMQAVLARSGQAVNKADRLLDELISANILWPEAEGRYRLAHLAWQEYLVARRIFERGDLETLAGHVDDPRYEQVFVLLAGLQRKEELIRLIRERSQNPPRALFLAARCLPEADQTDGQLRAEIARELFALFRAESPELWPEAAAAIAGLEDQSVEVALPRALEAPDPELRQNAAWVLGRVGKEWAVAPLIAALEDHNPHVRQRAAWALGEIKDERAIQPLIRVFNDRDGSVAEEAARALANQGQVAVQPLIHTFSAPEEQARRGAILALSRIGTPAIDLLLQALGNERKEVREGAKSALIGIGEAGVEHLVRAFAQVSGDELPEIVDVLAGIGGLRALRSMIAALPQAQGEMRRVLIKDLVHLGEPAVNELTEALLDNDLRDPALEALAACGDVATARLSTALRDERWKMRWRAVQALGELRRAAALEPILARLGDSRREVKRAAVEALRQIADQRAVEPLLTVLADEDDAVRWEAAKALGELRDGRAIRPLLAALTDKTESVRQNAASSLVEIGPTVVQPLIETLYERGSRGTEAYDYAVNILDGISARYRTEEPARANLAAIYYQLLTGEYTVDELLPALRELSWWEHGDEIYQLFRLLDSLLRCRSIEEITVEKNELDRLSNSTRWLLHTELRTWLRNLGETLEDIAWYRVSLIEEARQDVLFRAKTAAKGLEDLAATFAEPEMRALREVSAHLHRLVIEAIGRGTGRAKLQLALRTDQVRIAAPDSPTVLAYDLENIGDAPAWNVRLALKAPSGQQFAIIEGKREYPYVLKPGEKRGSDFLITPRRAGFADLSFDIVYDDATKEGHFGRLSGGKVYFFEKPAPYRPPEGESPYNFSQPVEVPTMFYGRRDILEWVQENLGAKYQENILVLHGHRRTGKSSVLTQLALQQPSQRYLFVLYRADQVGEFGSEGAILYHMGRVIQAELSRGGMSLPKPIWSEYQTEPRHRFRAFLEELDQVLGERRIALMVDEFDLLIEAVEKGQLERSFFSFLRGQMQYSKKLSFIIAGALLVTQMLKDGTSILFNNAKPKWIGYLPPGEAQRLIKEPVGDFLEYHDLAVEKIVEITSGHPFFIQYICDYLFHQAKSNCRNYVDLLDVNLALQETIRNTTAQLVFDYKLLPASHRMTLAALANVSDEWTSASPAEVQKILSRRGRGTLAASTVLPELQDLGFVRERRLGQEREYRFGLELLRLWLEANPELSVHLGDNHGSANESLWPKGPNRKS